MPYLFRKKTTTLNCISPKFSFPCICTVSDFFTRSLLQCLHSYTLSHSLSWLATAPAIHYEAGLLLCPKLAVWWHLNLWASIWWMQMEILLSQSNFFFFPHSLIIMLFSPFTQANMNQYQVSKKAAETFNIPWPDICRDSLAAKS